jgi:hypothetical protein
MRGFSQPDDLVKAQDRGLRRLREPSRRAEAPHPLVPAGTTVRISGYTDSVGTQAANMRLSRARGDGLDEARALQAIDRIGAALVFGRKTTIAIPDSELVFSNEERSLDLAQVLPDWSPVDRARLLTRPVFDPATFGDILVDKPNASGSMSPS